MGLIYVLAVIGGIVVALALAIAVEAVVAGIRAGCAERRRRRYAEIDHYLADLCYRRGLIVEEW